MYWLKLQNKIAWYKKPSMQKQSRLPGNIELETAILDPKTH